MSNDISNLRATILPKSDQLNAEQLIDNPITVRVTNVSMGSDDQPLIVHYENDDGRPYKPCKTVRKILIHAWGDDGRKWVGQAMTLFHDPSIRYGGAEVGGIRVSHVTGITKNLVLALTATRGKKVLQTIKPLLLPDPATGMSPSVLADWIASLDDMFALAELEQQVRAGLAEAKEIGDRPAYDAIKAAGLKRKEIIVNAGNPA
jgi:hypothetical protein